MRKRNPILEITRAAAAPVYRRLRRVVRFFTWSLPSLARLIQTSPDQHRRVLLVYDTSTQPFSVGDLLIFQEASLLLCDEFDLRRVDLAILYDASHPASSDPVFTSNVNEDNFFYHLASLLPIAQVNPKLGSLLVFDSYAHIQAYVADNLDRYLVWPSGWEIATREYLSPVVFNDLLRRYYSKHRTIPKLSCKPFLRSWAEAFFALHAGNRVPITVNLRNNPGWHAIRNSRIEAWLEFFSDSQKRYNAVFIIICSRSEIDERFRCCPNVILAKDHDTGVEQDMALIHTSAMHMGASSGPATMAWFNTKPYLMVNTAFDRGRFFSKADIVQEAEGVQRLWFASPLQCACEAVESKELLTREFHRIWVAANLDNWYQRDRPDPRKASLTTWLR